MKIQHHADEAVTTVDFSAAPDARSGTTVVFFHGGLADQHQLLESGALEELNAADLQLLSEKKVRLVLPSIGNSFLTGEVERRFFEESLKRHVAPGRGPVFITGNSMGGQAALHAYLRRPWLFAGAGAIFPALALFDFKRPAEAAAFAARHGRPPEGIAFFAGMLRDAFGDLEGYEAYDPIRLASAATPAQLHGKPLYLCGTTTDAFAFDEGIRQLSQSLFRRDLKHIVKLVNDGAHDLAFVKREFMPMLRALLV